MCYKNYNTLKVTIMLIMKHFHVSSSVGSLDLCVFEYESAIKKWIVSFTQCFFPVLYWSNLHTSRIKETSIQLFFKRLMKCYLLHLISNSSISQKMYLYRNFCYFTFRETYCSVDNKGTKSNTKIIINISSKSKSKTYWHCCNRI